jgi:pyruvate dehydrogenase E2 component (dihydrolipoamide acetyltransferase)
MAVEVVMPKLSDTMEEGTILKWMKQVGETVARGEVLAEVETDKADMELEAATAGVLQEIKVPEGENAAVGAVIALVDENATARDGGTSKGAPAPPDGATAGGDVSSAARPPAKERATAKGAGAPSEAAAPPPAADFRKASPAARKLAGERGVDLRMVQGSGPGGRIVADDVESAAKKGGGEASPPARGASERAGASAPNAETPRTSASRDEPRGAPASGGAVPSRGGRSEDVTRGDAGDAPAPDAAAPVVERHELSRMRQSIARRMTEAFREIPHFYVTAEIDMTEAVRLKDALARSELFATPISYTHMVLKATALALKRHPRLNASYRDGALELKGDVNIGMAVAVEDGLIVPVLRHVDELPLADIAAAARRLVEQTRRGRFGREDLSGGTFTVSNMGMLDIEEFAAVINPPQAAILAVGAIKERAVVRHGAVGPAQTMRVTLSCDHRIIDGVVAGHFLEELKRLLENPIVLAVRE